MQLDLFDYTLEFDLSSMKAGEEKVFSDLKVTYEGIVHTYMGKRHQWSYINISGELLKGFSWQLDAIKKTIENRKPNE